MDLESSHSLQQKFLAPQMRSDAITASTATGTLACDLGSFFSFSCRNRAEDFARTLQVKLKTLGSFDNFSDGQSQSLDVGEPPWKALSLDSHLSRQKQMPEGAGKNNRELNTIKSGVTNSKPVSLSSDLQHAELPLAQTSLDSDIYYDFDICSPRSPVSPPESSSCFAVINPCDDLYCTDCLQNRLSTSDDIKINELQFGSTNGSISDNGLESGCIFTSPETMSPSGELDFPVYNIQHSNSADDCTSDASDSSIYYDVEPFTPVPSPKPELEVIQVPEKIIVTDMSQLSISQKNFERPVTTVEEMKLLLSTIGTSYGAGDAGSGSEDEDNSSTKIPRITRSSSLKSGKTPPGTPGTKKIVRFADALGLDLAAVRTFLDEIPKVPKSAFRDLDCPLASSPFSFPATPTFQKGKPAAAVSEFNKILVPTFHQPATRPDFFDKIRDNKVYLENAFFSDNFTIKGAVRVLNMDFHKSVYIRYTYDEWKTFTDFQATYVKGSCDGFSDRFEFTVQLRPEMIEIGSRIILAVRFHCKGEQFWDNNCGSDYLFHCVMGTTGPQSSFHSTSSMYPSMYGSSPEDPWTNHMWF